MFFRFNNWVPYILPPILSVAGLILVSQIEQLTTNHLCCFFLFIFSTLCTAAFGYFINDWADIEVDKIANKINFASKFNKNKRLFISLLLFLLGLFPWIYLKKSIYGTIGLYIWFFEILLFLLYSFPPFRFKNRAFIGILCDALYAHTLPIGMAVAVFCETATFDFPLLSILFLLLLLKGLRNIIIHQIQDRKADKLVGTNTFVLAYGVTPSLFLVNKLLIPLEIILNFVVYILMYRFLPALLWAFLLFILWYIITIRSWSKPSDASWRWYNRFWYFLNNYYEDWLLYVSSTLFIIKYQYSFLWLIVLIALFPNPLIRIYEEYLENKKIVQAAVNKFVLRPFKRLI